VIRPSLIWVVAGALYAGFLLWYTGIGGPLTPEEIERYVEIMAQREPDEQRLAGLRKFLEEDTGGDFVIVNAILLHRRPLRVGEVGESESSREVLDRYMSYMWPALLARACHPVVGGPAAAIAVEAWGLENAEEWTMAGLMRYRSRRDMMEIATDPAFHDAHEFKIAAIEKTIAFPIDPFFQLGGPRPLVGLLLFGLSATLHLGLGRRSKRGRTEESGA
jgi:hypothetical protein